MTVPESYVLQTAFTQLPVAVGGKGVFMDVKDPKTGQIRTILDGSSGAAVSSVGHGDDEIRQKMSEAALDHIYTFPVTMSNDQSEKLAKFIIDNSPPNAFASATFTGSGSEANENMMKLVRKYHITNGDLKRIKFISRTQSYHGFTIGALSLSDTTRRVEFNDILLPQSITPKALQCYPYRHQEKGESLEAYKDRLLKNLEDVFIKEGPETIGAFIAETVTGSTFGCNPPIPGYLDGCKAICRKYGALFVLDEVMSGMGRCGSLHAWEQFMDDKEGPDIQTVGKTLGAGYVTIAGILISPLVINLLKEKKAAAAGGQTYHCHGFNCAVGLAVQEKVKRDGLIENIKVQGNYFGETLKSKLIPSSKIVGDVRGAGGFWAVEFVKDTASKEPFPPSLDFAHKFSDKAYENGLFCLAGNGTLDGKSGDHALFSPAFSITREEVDKMIEIVLLTVQQLEKEYA